MSVSNTFFVEMKLLFALLFVVVKSGWSGQCSSDYGPAGVTECIQVSRYNNEYQWATCLTDAYIKQKSRHQHHCRDRLATYCWYQCMLEVHNKRSGSVTQDCSCKDAGSTTPNPFTGLLIAILPPHCYSPSGDSCDWYRNCLERKYPCEDTSNAYAITYAEKFCRLYDERYFSFSVAGQKWMNAVRKCLQVYLVPLLRSWVKPTCQEIREKAFASHTPCYLYPDKDAPSVCDLSCFYVFKIFFTIKGSFINMDTAGQSFKGLLTIGSECGPTSQIPKCFRESKDWITNKEFKTYNRFVNIFKIIIKTFEKSIKRDRRWADPTSLPKADARIRFADGVGSALEKALKWNTEVMDWIAYTENKELPKYEDPDNMAIVVVFADKKALGIVQTSSPFVNFDQTVKEFAVAIKGGQLPLEVEGCNVWVRSLSSCAYQSCNDTTTLAVSDVPPIWKGGTETSQTNARLLGVCTALVLFVNKLLL
ncbi:uncharacterized protein LOC114957145 isoform X1 [Acropora millepora]|uniref:uncharacterized protein LOC114957145 isoform X1 n=2 Tax=Acropora millepora TaxID=45264 RepID=UPI001CF12732|nr:uncharacterized protein LOC114957145 isoform X1 [Acropora millepora]